MTEPAIVTKSLRFGYDQTDILKGIDLAVATGEFVGIIGPNGSGKSTLIKSLNGYLRPTAGEISIFGKPLVQLNRREAARMIALVPQELTFYFPYTVAEFIMMGRHPYQGITSLPSDRDVAIIEQVMNVTDTLKLRNRSIMELSGGEKQRVVLASALAQDTKLILLDEPTSSLDMYYQIEIYSILQNLNRTRQLTVVAVTHDLNLGALYCDRLVLLAEGLIVADGPPQQIITADLIAHYFGVEVICAVSEQSGRPYVVSIGKREV